MLFCGARMPHRLTLVLVVCIAMVSSSALAQTVRDKVKDHVGDGLEGKRKRKRGGNSRSGSKRRGSKRRGARSSSRGGSNSDQPTHTVSLDLDDPALTTASGPRLPRRLFPNLGEYFALDLRADAAYRGWLPQQYSSADVDVASYATWSVGVKGKLFRYLALYRGYYESNGLSSPRNKDAAVAAQVGKYTPKAAKALAYLGFPFWKSWQPIIRYQAHAFNTKATPKIPVCIVDRSDSGDLMDCPRSLEPLRVISSFETLIAGVRHASQVESKSFFATRKGKLPPFYFGLGMMAYNKPYQVTVDDDTLEEFLFDGRFRGAGLAVGTSMGGGARRFFAHVDLQFGLGEVSLTDDLTLNEVAPDDWVLGYVQGNLRAGYRFVIFDGPPTIYFKPTASAGGASFHFISTRADEGRDNNAPTLNWDLLWSARAAIEVAL